MKEAFGSAFVVQFVIIFVIIFIFFFVGGLSYTKAFKVKNRIVDIIEQHEVYDEEAKTEINSVLQETGYRVSNKTSCTNTRFDDKKGELISSTTQTYNYCVYKLGTADRPYYGAVAYMYFDIPIIGAKLEFPVYGETRVMGEY